MKTKTVITTALFLFVGVSVAYLVGRETGLLSSSPSPAGAAAEAGRVVYYFHGNRRCTTCQRIEAYTATAVQSGFTRQLEDGRLAWRVVNVDEPANAHFVEDFELVTRSVVLAEFIDGECVRWRNLPDVWDLVGDEGAFIAYVQDETRAFLEAGE